ncbi:MAG: hypothetical protein HY819_05635 [Acidobacteria bacterium]|nr:hypothetical protein [Acidobacteriota bacterium]
MFKLLTLIFLLCFVSLPTYAAAPWNQEGQFQTAIVVDTGLSVLRKSPDITSTALRRLRIGRKIFIISTTKNQGLKYYFVAVTRRTRGYIDASALINPSWQGEDVRLMRLIENAEGVDKIILSQTLVKYFPKSRFCPDALLAEGETAEQIAKELSKRTSRASFHQLDPELEPEKYLLNYSGLDKYSRLGVNFFIDSIEKSYRYNGTAYKKILSRYPKSQAALLAKEKLEIVLVNNKISN